MKSRGVTRWVIAGASLGLSAALSAGVAFAVAPGPTAPSASQATSMATSRSGTGASGTGFPMGSLGGATGMMGGGAAAYGAMGSSMTGGGGASGGAITNASLAALVSHGEQGASVDPTADTVTYKGQAVTLVALASPHGKPNMTWEIDGLVNPTVVVRPGAQLDVVLVNTDWGYVHGFELTTTPPPYPYMAMAGVAPSFFLMPLPPRTTKDTATATFHTESAAFITRPGTYHYLCPVPGHAAMGMFGTLIVG